MIIQQEHQREFQQFRAVCYHRTDAYYSTPTHHYGRHMHILHCYQEEDTHTGQHQGEEVNSHHAGNSIEDHTLELSNRE